MDSIGNAPVTIPADEMSACVWKGGPPVQRAFQHGEFHDAQLDSSDFSGWPDTLALYPRAAQSDSKGGRRWIS